jgi:hypothetical protein
VRDSRGPTRAGSYAVLMTVLAGLVACGAQTTPEAAPPANPPQATTTVAPAPSPTPTAAESEDQAGTVTPTTVKVPNGVGLDYQSAQDKWRAVGLHVAPAIDALGENRLPVIDANWVVISQDPPAGKKVPADSFITATVKKSSD